MYKTGGVNISRLNRIDRIDYESIDVFIPESLKWDVYTCAAKYRRSVRKFTADLIKTAIPQTQTSLIILPANPEQNTVRFQTTIPAPLKADFVKVCERYGISEAFLVTQFFRVAVAEL